MSTQTYNEQVRAITKLPLYKVEKAVAHYMNGGSMYQLYTADPPVVAQITARKIKEAYDRGELDLTKQIEVLKQKAQDAELELSLVKAVGMNSPEMKALKTEISELKKDNQNLAREVSDYIERIKTHVKR